jgi:hypothetical protein
LGLELKKSIVEVLNYFSPMINLAECKSHFLVEHGDEQLCESVRRGRRLYPLIVLIGGEIGRTSLVKGCQVVQKSGY